MVLFIRQEPIGNPIAVSAGTALLRQLKDQKIYEKLEKMQKFF